LCNHCYLWLFVTKLLSGESIVEMSLTDAVTDEPQLMLTAGPSAMVYGATPGMYGTYPASGMPGYGMQM